MAARSSLGLTVIWSLAGVLVDLVPRFLTSEERAVVDPVPEPESAFNEWLLERFAQALASWRRGLPLMLCSQLFAGEEGAVHWFPSFPGTEVCEPCGSRIRAATSAFPNPLRRCDVCQRDVPLGAWLTTATYDSEDWCAQAMMCQDCTGSFGELTADEMISEGIEELELLANKVRGSDG
jgi:hypothetical protein